MSSLNPSVIFYNGKIYTVDPKRSVASAVAVCDDTILAVGSDAPILAMAGPETKRIDLKGKRMLPGLNDSHCHPFFMAQDIDRLSLLPAKNIRDVLDLLAGRAETLPEGEWVYTKMAWHETQLAEGRFPTRREIDSVVPNHPVCIQRGGHIKVCNSLALKLAGIDDGIQDPPGGHFGREPDGTLNGLLLDAASAMMEKVLPKVLGPKYVQALKDVGKQLNQFGVTTTAEMGAIVPIIPVHKNNFETLMRLYSENSFTARMSAVIYAADYEMAKWAVEFGEALPATDFFRFRGIKLMQDGGIEGAWLNEPYEVFAEQPNPDFHGVRSWPESRKDEFRKIMQLVADHGLMLQIHTNGDASADYDIGMFAEQGEKTDIGKLNWTICHLPLASQEDLDLLKKYDICVSIQHQPYLLGLNARKYWGVERADSQANYRKLWDMGIRIGGGTDFPIGPASPFPCIQFMVDRKIIDGSVLGPDSALTLEEVIYLWTQGSANIEGWGDKIGSIEPGKKADLVVLNQDIFEIPVDEIHNTTVAQTWLDGKCVYED